MAFTDEPRGREGLTPIYVGHGRRGRERYGPTGASLANAYPMGYASRDNADNDLRAEVCRLCAQLNPDPLRPAPWPRDRRATPLPWLITPEARRNREMELEALAARVAGGEGLLLLCHCRGRGWARQADNLCHADDLAVDIRRRATGRVGQHRAAGPPPRPGQGASGSGTWRGPCLAIRRIEVYS